AIGKFISEEAKFPLKYNDAKNSDVEFDKLLTYDLIESVGGGWLVSDRLVNIIDMNFPKEVQFFRSTFNYKDKICDSYSAINIYNRVDCYDLDKSEFVKHPVDGSYKFSKIALKKEPLEEYGMIYNIVRNSFDNKVVVSELFVEHIKSNQINSITFKKA
ncbi:imm11 family protein, partial [Flavobacterium cerinum]|uniref:imm11 family protein n=1 Tax=Flavobacterium cerinum TaxID=2502784 RepID=UPI0013E388A6